MNPVEVRGVKIGKGIPKICVPIVGKKRAEIIAQAEAVAAFSVDLVEWRADWFEDIFREGCVEDILEELRRVLGNKPILFTFRTAAEGGEREIAKEEYVWLLEAAAVTGNIDLIDVELFMGDEIVRKIVQRMKTSGVKVIASNHDFNGTPAKDELIRRMERMREMGADIPKVAVMPQNRRDVLTLLAATEEMTRNHVEYPVITMSMGETGVISRVCGEVFGSAVTFGSVGKASAPGQMEAEELYTVLCLLHRAGGE